MAGISSLLGLVAPVWALRRKRAAIALEQTRAYEGASRRDGWRPRRAGASADADHLFDARELRIRARSLEQNVPYIQRALDVRVSAAIGMGISPRAEGLQAETLTRLWWQWAGEADADRATDINGLMALAYRARLRDGEVLIRRRTRRPEDGLTVPLQLQVLEIDWLSSKTETPRDGNRIINGIEYNAIGAPVAYWLHENHPGDTNSYANKTVRVPADQIIHFYQPTRPGQGRGISALAPVIARTRDLMTYEDAELARKNLETRLSVLVSGDLDGMENPPTKDDDDDLGELRSGAITALPPGMEPTIVEPKAAPGYVDYVQQQLHLIAAGIGVPYESMTGDMHRVNFSSARIRQIEFRRDVEQEQWLNIIPQLCRPIWRWFVDAAWLANKVRTPDYSTTWATPRWDYVNPVQDINAEISAIGAGLLTPSESLRRRGYDPDAVFAEAAGDFARLKDSGAIELLSFFRGGVRAVAAHIEEPEDE